MSYESAALRRIGLGLVSMLSAVACGDRLADDGDAGSATETGAESGTETDPVAEVSAGLDFACARSVGGRVSCWGSEPEEVELPAGVVDVAVGFFHVCALFDTGAVRCWGDNLAGQLGYGHVVDLSAEAAGDVEVGFDTVAIASGAMHTCVLSSAGAVRCWGANSYGQLGYGNTLSIGDDELPASAGDVDVAGSAVDLIAGGDSTCVRLASGGVRCWGGVKHSHWPTTIGDDEVPGATPEIDVGGTVVQLSAGYTHICARLDTGTVRCWGWGGSGQLGYASTDSIEDPAGAGDIDLGGIAVEVSAGLSSTCARLQGGTVRCWGSNVHGQLGYGHTNSIGDDETPAAAGDVDVGTREVEGITAGWPWGVTCARFDTGAVRCWGRANALGYPAVQNIGDGEAPAAGQDVPLW